MLVAGACTTLYVVGPRKAMMDVLGGDEDALEAALGLGELAGLTVTNEADAYDVRNCDNTGIVLLAVYVCCMICYSCNLLCCL